MGKNLNVDTGIFEVLKQYIRRLFSSETHREMSFTLKLISSSVVFFTGSTEIFLSTREGPH